MLLASPKIPLLQLYPPFLVTKAYQLFISEGQYLTLIYIGIPLKKKKDNSFKTPHIQVSSINIC